jgi:hypothetical protein
MCSAPIVNEETRHQLIFYVCKTIRNSPRPLKFCNSPWSDVFMCALIELEESYINRDFIYSNSLMIIKKGMCILNVQL